MASSCSTPIRAAETENRDRGRRGEDVGTPDGSHAAGGGEKRQRRPGTWNGRRGAATPPSSAVPGSRPRATETYVRVEEKKKKKVHEYS